MTNTMEDIGTLPQVRVNWVPLRTHQDVRQKLGAIMTGAFEGLDENHQFVTMAPDTLDRLEGLVAAVTPFRDEVPKVMATDGAMLFDVRIMRGGEPTTDEAQLREDIGRAVIKGMVCEGTEGPSMLFVVPANDEMQ